MKADARLVTFKSWSRRLAASARMTMKKTAGSPRQSFPRVGMMSTTCGASRNAARPTAAWNRGCCAKARGRYTKPLSRVLMAIGKRSCGGAGVDAGSQLHAPLDARVEGNLVLFQDVPRGTLQRGAGLHICALRRH